MWFEVGRKLGKVVENERSSLLSGAGICPASTNGGTSALEFESVATVGFSLVTFLVLNVFGFVERASDFGGSIESGDGVEVVDASFAGGIVYGERESVVRL